MKLRLLASAGVIHVDSGSRRRYSRLVASRSRSLRFPHMRAPPWGSVHSVGKTGDGDSRN